MSNILGSIYFYSELLSQFYRRILTADIFYQLSISLLMPKSGLKLQLVQKDIKDELLAYF